MCPAQVAESRGSPGAGTFLGAAISHALCPILTGVPIMTAVEESDALCVLGTARVAQLHTLLMRAIRSAASGLRNSTSTPSSGKLLTVVASYSSCSTCSQFFPHPLTGALPWHRGIRRKQDSCRNAGCPPGIQVCQCRAGEGSCPGASGGLLPSFVARAGSLLG